MSRSSNGFTLQVLLEQLARVPDSVGAKGVEVIGTEAGQGIQGCDDEIQSDDLVLCLGDLLLENNVRIGHKLITQVFQVVHVFQIVDSLDSLEVQAECDLGVVALDLLEQLNDELEDFFLGDLHIHRRRVFIIILLFTTILLLFLLLCFLLSFDLLVQLGL